MKYKTYTIESKEFNAVDLAKEVGISQPAARNRLKANKTIKALYRTLHESKYKKHVIEGEAFTTPEVAKKLNCSFSAARGRLGKCNTIEKLLRPLDSRLSTQPVKFQHVKVRHESAEELQMRKLAMRAW